MKRILISLITIAISGNLLAQLHVQGFIRDYNSNENLIGAHIVEINSINATISDNNGYFSIFINVIPELEISYVGYKKIIVKVYPEADSILIIHLEQGNELDPVTVRANRNLQTNVMSLSHAEMTSIPSLGSKPDLLKTIQLLPGIQSGPEGSSYISVRGGDPGQNLYLIDNSPLIYVNHLGGFMSVFNPDMINSVKIYKGSFPAMYGGKLSSIVDITQKEGDNKTTKSSVSIGLTDISATFEGPVKNRNASYIISGRKTLFDPLLWLASGLSDGQDFRMMYGFHDINAKYSYKSNNANTFHFNLYHGDDYLIYRTNNKNVNNIDEEKAGTQYIWGNWLLSGNWKYVMGNRLHLNSGMSYSRYRSRFGQFYNMTSDNDKINYETNNTNLLSDLSLHSDWNYNYKHFWKINFGIHSAFVSNMPQRLENSGFNTTSSNSIQALHTSLYLENDIRISDKAMIKPGLRVGNYLTDGWGDYSVEPRFLLSYDLTLNQSLNLTYMKAHQYNHMFFSNGAINNKEIWVSANESLPPSVADQFSLGWELNLRDKMFRAEMNLYYKKMSELANYKSGNKDLTNSYNGIALNGKGISTGVEFMLKKNYGEWSGFLSYSFSNTTRQFSDINEGKEYPYEFNRPHSASISINRKISNSLSFNALWVYQTGLPYTPAFGKQIAPGLGPNENGENFYYDAIIYGERNSANMKDYHRLDISLQYDRLTKNGRPSTWTFSVYNLYNRQNPWYYYYNNNNTGEIYIPEFGIDQKAISLYQISLFPIMPTFSYKVYFDKSTANSKRPGERIRNWLYYE